MLNYPHVIYVYVTTNLINGKQYIGDHLSYRLDNSHKDSYFGSGKIITRAIKKYGQENFKKEILEYFNTKEESFDAQERYIKKFNTLVPNGYNISIRGGVGPRNTYQHSEEAKEKMRKSHTGLKHSKETRKKQSKSHTGLKYNKHKTLTKN